MPELKEKAHDMCVESGEDIGHAWQEFVTNHAVSPPQAEQFRRYLELLMTHNKQVNLTAIVSPRGVIKYHFTDSLMLAKFFPVNSSRGLVDVGTGAGFPALPLKIMYPELPMVLIEPNGKKRRFLELIIEEMGFTDIETCKDDWRTFIRTTAGDLDLFVSRAALAVPELCRMFKPSSAYNQGTLVYWASELWEPEEGVESFIDQQIAYRVGTRKRKLIFLKNKQ